MTCGRRPGVISHSAVPLARRVDAAIEMPIARRTVLDAKQTRGPHCVAKLTCFLGLTVVLQCAHGPRRGREGERQMARLGLLASVIAAGCGLASPALAQQTVYIPAILELSGAGAVSGTNFRDGMLMAIEEINAKGGILGRKIDTPLLDTQSDASTSRAQIQKVLDNNPYVILGPVSSGSVLV